MVDQPLDFGVFDYNQAGASQGRPAPTERLDFGVFDPAKPRRAVEEIPLPPPPPPGEPAKDNAGAFSGPAIFAQNAANTALFNIPRHVQAGISTLSQGEIPLFTESGRKKYGREYQEIKDVEAQRQAAHPYWSGAGTGAGVVGSLAVPMTSVAKLGQAGYLGAAAAGAGLAGASSYIDDQNWGNAGTNAAIGAGLGVALRPVANAIASRFNGAGQAVDRAGNLTPEARDVITRALPNLAPEDINAMSGQFANTMRQKGVNADAAREAMLVAQGLPASRSIATGYRPPPAAAEAAQENLDVARRTVAQNASEIAPSPTTPFTVAQHLQDAQTTAHNAASAQYDRAFGHAGEFHDSVARFAMPMIQRELQSAQIPPLTGMTQLPQYQAAVSAAKLVDNTLVQGNMPFGQTLNMTNLESVRKGMNAIRREAIGEDRRAVDAIIRGYDNSIVEGVNAGLFSGNGAAVIRDMQQARQMWGNLQQTFYSKQAGPDRVVSSALRQFQQMQQRDPSGRLVNDLNDATAAAAQGVLNSNLINKSLGPAVYDKLLGIFGGQGTEAGQALAGHIRSSILNTGGDTKKLVQNIDQFLDPRGPNALIANRVFTTEERSQLRQLAQAARLINTRPTADPTREHSVLTGIKSIIGRSIFPGLLAWSHSPVLGLLGYAIEQPVVAARQAARNVGARRAESMGAPAVQNIIPTQAVPNAASEIDRQREPAVIDVSGARPVQRASGGKVKDNHDALVNRLMTLAEKAKRATNKATEPLLGVDDSSIAHALQTADAAI